MPYKLYNRPGSGGFAVEAALALAEQTVELITIDSKPSTDLPESFRETNAWRQVPVLVTPDGTVMTESAAMLIWIAEQHPGKDVGPAIGSQDRAQLLRWVVFLSVNVYEAVLRRVYPGRYVADPEAAPDVRRMATQRNDDAFVMLERELVEHAFLLGSEMSVADVYLAMLFAWHAEHDAYPNCQKLTHRVARHSVVAPIWQRNFDHRLAVKWGR